MFMLYKPSGRHRTTLRMLDPEAGDAILDVGCSAGYFEHHFLRGKVARAVGVDINDAAVRFAQSSVTGVEFYCCPSNALPFEDNSFDKVLFEDVLEHVDDETGTLREIKRVLRPGGLLVLSTPNDFLNRLDRNYPEHRHYSAAKLREMLAAQDFEVQTVHRSSLLPHLVGFVLRFGRTATLARIARRITSVIENVDHRFNLGFGFTIAVTARTRAAATEPVGAAA